MILGVNILTEQEWRCGGVDQALAPRWVKSLRPHFPHKSPMLGQIKHFEVFRGYFLILLLTIFVTGCQMMDSNLMGKNIELVSTLKNGELYLDMAGSSDKEGFVLEWISSTKLQENQGYVNKDEISHCKNIDIGIIYVKFPMKYDDLLLCSENTIEKIEQNTEYIFIFSFRKFDRYSRIWKAYFSISRFHVDANMDIDWSNKGN